MARKQTVGERFDGEDGAKANASAAVPLKTSAQIAGTPKPGEKPEVFPKDLKAAFVLLAQISAEQVSSQEEWEAKQPRLKALKAHIHTIQQGLPLVEPKSGDVNHAHMTSVMAGMKLALRAKAYPEVAEVVRERDALKLEIQDCRLKIAANTSETLAGKLYTIYCAAVGGKAFNGEALPAWDVFRADEKKKAQSDAWVAVANEAIKTFTA